MSKPSKPTFASWGCVSGGLFGRLVEAYQLDGARCEFGSAFWGGGGDFEVGAVGPSADGEEDLEVAVTSLEEVELLEAAVEVRAGVVPAVGQGRHHDEIYDHASKVSYQLSRAV